MEAVPIDKYFELFKPGAEGGLGGKIRITLKSESAAGAAGRERRGVLLSSVCVRVAISIISIRING